MMKPTPGPWYIASELFDAKHGDITIAARQEDGTIKLIGRCYPENEQAQADARLMKAAHKMLEALREIAKGAGPYSRDPLTFAENVIESAKEIAGEAIAEAEGQEAQS